MTIKESIKNYYNKPRERVREPGKYFASEIWYMSKGYLTVPEFIRGMEKGYAKKVDEQGMANMFRGSAAENMLYKILKEEGQEFEVQNRYEVNVAGIIISGKLDFEFPDKVVETKCPNKPTNGIPDKWSFQLELYHRMTGKPVYLGIFDKQGSEVIRFFPYEPSEEVWSLIKETVLGFHEKLLKKLK